MSKDLASVLNGIVDDEVATNEVLYWVDTGFPPLNKAISGDYNKGFPSTRLIEMFGPESSGKTAIATMAMIATQKMGGVAWFNDHERSFMSPLAVGLGLDMKKNFIMQTPDTFEQSVTRTIKGAQAIRDNEVIPPEAPITVVFDSLASMIPKSKLAKDVDEQGMNDSLALAKATSSVFPTLAQFTEKLNMCILILNQEREKPGVVYGDPTTTPGGKAPKFYASVRIQIGRKRIIEKDGKEKRMIGQEITAKCIKNKVNRPFDQASWRFMFREDGSGFFDVTSSLIDHLVDIGVIKSSGARVTWTDGKSYYRKALADKITAEGLEAELKELLPKK